MCFSMFDHRLSLMSARASNHRSSFLVLRREHLLEWHFFLYIDMVIDANSYTSFQNILADSFFFVTVFFPSTFEE